MGGLGGEAPQEKFCDFRGYFRGSGGHFAFRERFHLNIPLSRGRLCRLIFSFHGTLRVPWAAAPPNFLLPRDATRDASRPTENGKKEKQNINFETVISQIKIQIRCFTRVPPSEVIYFFPVGVFSPSSAANFFPAGVSRRHATFGGNLSLPLQFSTPPSAAHFFPAGASRWHAAFGGNFPSTPTFRAAFGG